MGGFEIFFPRIEYSHIPNMVSNVARVILSVVFEEARGKNFVFFHAETRFTAFSARMLITYVTNRCFAYQIVFKKGLKAPDKIACFGEIAHHTNTCSKKKILFIDRAIGIYIVLLSNLA